MKKFIAQIDPELCDLVPEFLAHKRSDADAILSSISAKQIDFEALCGIGHKLKGEGGSYGLNTISFYGAKIEQAARDHDIEAIRCSAKELAAYLDCLQIEYE
jgi:hypothetical protein